MDAFGNANVEVPAAMASARVNHGTQMNNGKYKKPGYRFVGSPTYRVCRFMGIGWVVSRFCRTTGHELDFVSWQVFHNAASLTDLFLEVHVHVHAYRGPGLRPPEFGFLDPHALYLLIAGLEHHLHFLPQFLLGSGGNKERRFLLKTCRSCSERATWAPRIESSSLQRALSKVLTQQTSGIPIREPRRTSLQSGILF